MGIRDRGGNEVLEQRDVVGVYGARIDAHLGDLPVARRRDGDEAAAGAPLHAERGQSFLRVGHLALRLLGFLHQFLYVHGFRAPARS